MTIIAIDPGNEKSAVVAYSDGAIVTAFIQPNEEVREYLYELPNFSYVIACEGIQSFGMAVGKTVFETAYFIGQLKEIARCCGFGYNLVTRMQVKMHLCHTTRAKDTNIRQALIDRYGGKELAIGNKKNPGVLYNIKADMWSAVAIAITYSETCVK